MAQFGVPLLGGFDEKRGWSGKTGLLKNEQIAQVSVIPSKTATQRVAVLRGNPSPFLENGLPRQSADWLAMTGFRQNVNFATGPSYKTG